MPQETIACIVEHGYFTGWTSVVFHGPGVLNISKVSNYTHGTGSVLICMMQLAIQFGPLFETAVAAMKALNMATDLP